MVSKTEQDRSAELVPLSLSSGTDEETSSNNFSEYSDSDINKHVDGVAGGGHAEFGEPGTASKRQVAVNIFISFVGSGMLGMPYAFSKSGWLLGTASLAIISSLNIYAMLLLVKTRRKLESKGFTGIHGYGDIGRITSGDSGGTFVNICLCISQLGFATAYIIFIAANLNATFGIDRAYICLGCVPILAGLVQIQDMKHLSPFSLIADVANISGLLAVMFQDFQAYEIAVDHTIIQFNFSKVLYVSSVSLYALEGVGMVLPLESSCADRKWFPSLLKNTLFAITALMAVFGCCGYLAFGAATEAPITLNLEGTSATVVKFALCIGLYFTFPIMMFPVNEVMEDMFLPLDGSRPNTLFRTLVVLFSALTAYVIPNFGLFLGLVGSSICTILGFILPCYFHLKAFGQSDLRGWEILLDYFLIIFGVFFGIMGTISAVHDLIEDSRRR